MDSVTLLGAIAAATTHLGLAATVSTGPNRPYSVVRQLSTLHYMSGGRVGWNIVTGHLRGEHRPYGLPELPHDERYDRAEEYMEVCYALCNSVGEGAVLADKESGIFADPDRVRRVQHKGHGRNPGACADQHTPFTGERPNFQVRWIGLSFEDCAGIGTPAAGFDSRDRM